MTTMQFGHVAFRVKNSDSMLDFYTRQLGLKEAFRIFNDDGSLRIVYIHISDGQFLELCLGGSERSAFDDQTTVGFRHLCLTVTDLAATKQTWEARGVVFDSEILLMKDHNLAAFVRDPDGNKLEIVQLMPESPQFSFLQSRA